MENDGTWSESKETDLNEIACKFFWAYVSLNKKEQKDERTWRLRFHYLPCKAVKYNQILGRDKGSQ